MERLSFTSRPSYNATEAAIHLARYQIAVPYANGKRILDIACGEGYGAFALQRVGAASVDAVDISAEAIRNAEATFSTPGVRFHRYDAERVDELFPGSQFDLVVCLETIEHLANPTRFLSALKKITHKDSVIIISCPNDHWYYPTDGQSNPFHIKKYSYEEFRGLTQDMLGPATAWGFGGPVIGFGTVPDDVGAMTERQDQQAMLDHRPQATASMLPPVATTALSLRTCSYFVGVWGGNAVNLFSSAVAPISMDYYANLLSWESSRAAIAELEAARAAERQQRERQLAEAGADREAERKAMQAAQRGAEHHRVQAFALAKELEIVTAQLQDRSRDRDRILNDARRLEQEAAASTSEAQVLRHRNSELETQHKQTKGDIERYRVQSFALEKEFQLISGQVSDLRNERARAERLSEQVHHLTAESEILAHRIVSLTAENEGIRQLSSMKDGVKYMARALPRAALQRILDKIRRALVSVARRVKPYLPHFMLRAARRMAYALGL